jgi:GDP-L-fucose synthase
MRVLITGGTGMVGSAFNNLKTAHELIFVCSKDYDLTSIKDTKRMFQDNSPDTVIHLAAKVGGIKANSDYMSEFLHKNMLINLNVLNSARIYKINKVVSLLSTCVYPDNPNYPLTEDQIHNGEPHESNFGYAYAKRMLEVQSRAIRKQYGLKYITAIPNNIYGENDNFDLENGHVLPAIIRKVYEAKLTGSSPVFWGSGRPLREFTYSYDIATALINLAENYEDVSPVNIGKTGEISILSVVEKICNILEFEGKVTWDIEKPEGQYRKPSDNNLFLNTYPNFKYTDIDEGLQKTCNWFLNHYPNIRGVK